MKKTITQEQLEIYLNGNPETKKLTKLDTPHRLRRLVAGVGVNNSTYKTYVIHNGKKVICPYYSTWSSMITRSYRKHYHNKYPSYINVTVCEEWQNFMTFREWMSKQKWEGKHLDKDIICPGNKEYSQKHCMFVNENINTILTNRESKRGKYPQGVYLKKPTGKYGAQISIGGRKKHLGYFVGIKEAEKKYLIAKSEYLREVSFKQTDEKLTKGLLLHSELFAQKARELS